MSACYAYNQDFQRCDKVASHTGNHRHTVTWDEAECWTPDPSATTHRGLRKATPTELLGNEGDDWTDNILEIPPVPVSTVPTCILCDHPKHPEGSCEKPARGLPRGTPCGCLTSA